MPIPQPNTPEMFDHSSYRDKWDRQGVVKFLTDMGLFIGQSQAFFAFLNQLATEADSAQRGA